MKPQEVISTALENSSVTYTASFVPKAIESSTDALAIWRGKDWEASSFQFLITLDDGRETLRIPYRMGCGHFAQIPTRLHRSRVTIHELGYFEAYRLTQITGSLHEFKEAGRGRVVNKKQRILPEIADVFHSIWLERDVLNYSFGDWCDMLGYSNDSITAREHYEHAVRQSLAVNRMFLRSDVESIENALEDY